MFLNTLGIERWIVLNWKNKRGIVSKRSDKHADSFKIKDFTYKVFELERQIIYCIPTVKAHYCRASSQKK